MRIIETNNFGGDYPNESFINIPPLPKEVCEEICNLINDTLNNSVYDCPRFWKTVENDYKLKPGFEP